MSGPEEDWGLLEESQRDELEEQQREDEYTGEDYEQ